MVSGKDIVRYLKRIRITPTHKHVVLLLLYARNKEVHAAAVEKGFIKKKDHRVDADGRKKGDVWTLSPEGMDFLRQLKGDFTPKRKKADWSTVRGRTNEYNDY